MAAAADGDGGVIGTISVACRLRVGHVQGGMAISGAGHQAVLTRPDHVWPSDEPIGPAP